MSAWNGNRPPLIRLLGECRIGGDEHPQRLTYRKGWALLAYLAVERKRAHPRSQIAALLWLDLGQQAALTNLRQVLRDLNRALLATVGEGVLQVDRETVRLCPQASYGLLDIDLLESEGADGVWLQDAGELLDGVVLERCDDFSEWLLGARSWVWRRLLGTLERARDDAAAGNNLELAVRLDRPASLHCCRAWGTLAEMLKKYPRLNIVLHGWTGTLHPGTEFPSGNWLLSVGLREMERPGLLASIPLHRLALESDGHPETLPELYRRAAQELGMTVNNLVDLVQSNMENLIRP